MYTFTSLPFVVSELQLIGSEMSRYLQVIFVKFPLFTNNFVFTNNNKQFCILLGTRLVCRTDGGAYRNFLVIVLC